jgi:micrococcal nuclease
MSYRAQCLNVVDGDTVDLFVDLGFRMYTKARFRLARINTPELNSADPAVVARAQQAREFVKQALTVLAVASFDANSWNLRIVPEKSADEYGRWLAEIFYLLPAVPGAVPVEVSLNQQLLDHGLAILYKK